MLWPMLCGVSTMEREHGSELKESHFRSPCPYEEQIEIDIVNTIKSLQTTERKELPETKWVK